MTKKIDTQRDEGTFLRSLSQLGLKSECRAGLLAPGHHSSLAALQSATHADQEDSRTQRMISSSTSTSKAYALVVKNL